MPRIEARAVVPVSAEIAVALSQTYAEIRYRWDPFVREQRLLNGATSAGKDVQTWTRSRHGSTMVSEYVTYKPPTHVGMRMVHGPRFFDSFSGGWNFTAKSEEETEAIWRYNFTCRPKWIRRVADPIGRVVLGRDIRKRLAHFTAACADPDIVSRLEPRTPSD